MSGHPNLKIMFEYFRYVVLWDCFISPLLISQKYNFYPRHTTDENVVKLMLYLHIISLTIFLMSIRTLKVFKCIKVVLS